MAVVVSCRTTHIPMRNRSREQSALRKKQPSTVYDTSQMVIYTWQEGTSCHPRRLHYPEPWQGRGWGWRGRDELQRGVFYAYWKLLLKFTDFSTSTSPSNDASLCVSDKLHHAATYWGEVVAVAQGDTHWLWNFDSKLLYLKEKNILQNYTTCNNLT